MSQDTTLESVSIQDRRELEREILKQRLEKKKKKYCEIERIRYALKVASETPEEKSNRLRRRRKNAFIRKVLRKELLNKKRLEETVQGNIGGELIASDKNLIELEQNQELNLSKREDEVKPIDTFVKYELDDYPLEQPNDSNPAGENVGKEVRDLKVCYEYVNQFSQQNDCIKDLESRSDVQKKFMKDVQQINYSDNCIKLEVEDYTFSAVSNPHQSNQIDNIVKQELDGYSVLSTNNGDQVEYSDNCIKQELDDITFSNNSVDSLEDKSCLELSISDCDENGSQEYVKVDDQLNFGNSKLKRFESVFCDLYIKAEEPAEKSVETSLESNEHAQNINTENAKYECILCNSSFSNRTSLVRHIVDSHFEKDIYLCEFCNDTFNSRQGVNKHINAIHVQKKGGNICTFCKAVFTKNEYLRIHIDSTHLKSKKFRSGVLTCQNNGDVQFKRKKFSCLFCKASFGSQMGVNRHTTITHVRKKRYICYLCDASYTTERYLKTHLEKIHLEKSTTTNNPPQIQKDKAAAIPVDQSCSGSLLKTLNHNLDTYLKKRSESAESICLFPEASFTTDRNPKTHIDNIDSKKDSITSNVEQSFNNDVETDVDTAIPVEQSYKFPWRYSP